MECDPGALLRFRVGMAGRRRLGQVTETADAVTVGAVEPAPPSPATLRGKEASVDIRPVRRSRCEAGEFAVYGSIPQDIGRT